MHFATLIFAQLKHHSGLPVIGDVIGLRAAMDSNYKPEVIDNFFKVLSDEQSLYLMGLSLASNDLAINLDSIGRYPNSENIYFFSNSISIIRELALLVVAVDKSDLSQIFSGDTKVLFELLKSDLVPFDNASLVKTVLKPIRDVSFHYDLTKSNEIGKIKSMLIQIRRENKISIGFTKDESSPLGQRYIYADSFRTNIANQFLTTNVVSKISSVAVNVVSFVDSFVNDLLRKVKKL